MSMTSTERTALLRVAGGRFDLLERAVDHARDELKLKVRARLQSEAEARMQQAQEGLTLIEAEARDLAARAQAYVRKCEQELGVTVGYYRTGRQQIGSGKNKREDLYFSTHRESNPITVRIENKWTVLDIQAQIDEAISQLDAEAGFGRYNIAKARVDFEEKVLLGAVTSEEATKLLAELPSVDDLPDPAALVEQVTLRTRAALTEPR